MAPRWDSTQDGLLRQLYARQHPIETIAAQIGRSPAPLLLAGARWQSRPVRVGTRVLDGTKVRSS
jgi:hypothetical protein